MIWILRRAQTRQTLPSSALFYAEFKDSVDDLSEKIRILSNGNKTAIAEIITILANKKSNMIDTSCVTLFEDAIKQLNFDYSSFTKLVELINTHNSKTREFQKSIEVAQKSIEIHMLSEAVSEIQDAENAIALKKKEVDAQNSKVSSISTNIDVLEKQIKNSQIPAEAINRDIAFIMGRDELVFENKPLGYRISRKGEIAENLSKGEENAIALVYFFNALTDVDTDIQNTIVVLDDPISSFDSNFYYNAIAYIREKTNTAGQVFVFTHKFSLLKDYSRMYADCSRYMIKRVNDAPTLVNEDELMRQFHDEYAFLFKQVYNFVKDPPTDTCDYLQYPNIARRLLEGFLTFKMPNNDDLMDKVLKMENGQNSAAGRAMMRLLNNRSHLRVISDGELSDDIMNLSILPETLRYLLVFIKNHDEKHYNVLLSQCEPASPVEIDILSTPVEKEPRTIKLYTTPVSAGFGTRVEADEPYEDYQTDNDEADFAVIVSGDSMKPDILDRDILLIKETEEVVHTKIGVFLCDGESYCKKKIDTEDGLLLVSTNKDYEPIRVSIDMVENNSFKTFGEVIQKVPAE